MNSPRAGFGLAMAMVIVASLSAAAALLALDARATYGARTTADEPHYLLTALSLGEDADLDVSDEIATRAYLAFHEVDLNEQTLPLNESGQRLSPHDPLLPALLAAPMKIGGWAAAKATLALLAGLTAAATLWVAVRRFGVSVGVGAGVVAAFFVSPPLSAYGTQVYPEMPAALAVVVGLAAVTGSLRRPGLIAVVAAVIALPWLAVKYAPLAAVLAVYALLILWRRGSRSQAVVMGSLLTVAGVVYLVFHQQTYGGWTVYAAGDHFVHGEFQVVGSDPRYLGRTRRLIGLLVDRRFGLLAWAPAYLALVPAVAVVIQRRTRAAVPLVALLATGWAMATWVALTMHGWWWPGRQLVVILPVGVIAVAVLAFESRIWFRFVILAGAVALLGWVWLVVEASTDRITLIVDFFETDNPLYRVWALLLPDHMNMTFGAVVLTVAWIGVICTLTVLTLRSLSARDALDEAAPAELLDAR